MFTTNAYPTSFYASPTGFSAQSIAAGEAIFAQNCTTCHGPDGHGDGPAAKDLQPPPADLTAGHIYAHSDGDLFWWITHGIGNTMPAFDAKLDAIARWNLIDFIHANADATRFGSAADAGMANAFLAPDFAVDCPDGSSALTSELRGRSLHLVFAGAHSVARVRELEPTAIVVRLDPSVSAVGSLCGTDDPDVAKAFALYAESSVEELDAVASRPEWRALPAVASGRVYATDGSSFFSRSGPRLLDGLEILAAILHPEAASWVTPPGSWVRIDGASGASERPAPSRRRVS